MTCERSPCSIPSLSRDPETAANIDMLCRVMQRQVLFNIRQNAEEQRSDSKRLRAIEDQD